MLAVRKIGVILIVALFVFAVYAFHALAMHDMEAVEEYVAEYGVDEYVTEYGVEPQRAMVIYCGTAIVANLIVFLFSILAIRFICTI